MRMCQSEELVDKHSRQRKQVQNPGGGKSRMLQRREGKVSVLCKQNAIKLER